MAALAVPTLLVAGCGASATPKAVPTPTSEFHIVASGYTPAQVLGWVTPTLQNGASLLTAQPAGATNAQVLAAAQQLGVACGVAQKELTQATWTGTAHHDELALAATVERITTLIATPPAALDAALQPQVATMNTQLAALAHDLAR